MNFQQAIEEEARKAMEADAGFQAFLAAQPKERPCDSHPATLLPIHPAASWENYRNAWSKDLARPRYRGCPECREEKLQQRLAEHGVPDVLLGCTLDNWAPGDAEEKQHLAAVRKFALEIRKGFLFLLGPVGTGKSHLAVAVMRTFQGKGVFVKQSTLLRELRATYNDKKADDPIEACQQALLLVLDEMGLSGGGRDEAPMLNEILDHRYNHLLPTVITSNLDWGTLREELGDRLSDRMRECAHAVLIFSGPSHRAEHRDKYFGANAQPKSEPPTGVAW